MQDKLEVYICRAELRHADAMARIFVNSFDLDDSVKLMYTKDEISPVIQAILHQELHQQNSGLKVAVTQDSGLVVGWMCMGILINPTRVPLLAVCELTSFAAQKLLLAHDDNPTTWPARFGLARRLLTNTIEGQTLYIEGWNRFIINTIVTDPAHRRRGVAAQLLHSALEHARCIVLDLTLSMWVQTPTVYEGLFWQQGFVPVDVFGINLDDYRTPEEKAKGTEGEQLGVRTWRQMKLVVNPLPQGG